MSCQQVPRLSEDPYTFTESPAATKYYNSQSQKLAVKAASSPIPPLTTTSPQLKRPLSKTSPQHLKHQLNGFKSNGIYVNNKDGILIGKSAPMVVTKSSVQIINNQSLSNTTNPPPLYTQQNAKLPSLAFSNHSTVKNVSSTLPVKVIASPDVHSPQIISSKLTPRIGIKKAPSIDVNSVNEIILGNKNGQLTINSKDIVKEAITPDGKNGIKCVTKSTAKKGPTGTKPSALYEKVAKLVASKAHMKIPVGPKKQSNGKSGISKKNNQQSPQPEVLQRIPTINQHSTKEVMASTASSSLDGFAFGANQEKSNITGLKAKLKDLNSMETVLSESIYSDRWLNQYTWNSDVLFNDPSLNREDRIAIKRSFLRRHARQMLTAQKIRHTGLARKRLVHASNLLSDSIVKLEKELNTKNKCIVTSCTNGTLAMTAYCNLHITLNDDQKLFHPCTAKFSDNSECKVPVFDISHERPLCQEHAWKRDNYTRILQEQKPKKICIKKKSKPKTKKKKKISIPVDGWFPPSILVSSNGNYRHSHKLSPLSNPRFQIELQKSYTSNIFDSQRSINHRMHHDSQLMSSNAYERSIRDTGKSYNSFISNSTSPFATSPPTALNAPAPGTPDMMTIVCENSSAYESSEDTGVGGLSESELIGVNDGMDYVEEIPLSDARLLEEHELTILNDEIPEAFNEFFISQQNEHFEPTQKEREDLERALQEVDMHVKNLEQMTGTNLLSGLFDEQTLCEPSDMDVVLHSTNDNAEIRGLVHT